MKRESFHPLPLSHHPAPHLIPSPRRSTPPPHLIPSPRRSPPPPPPPHTHTHPRLYGSMSWLTDQDDLCKCLFVRFSDQPSVTLAKMQVCQACGLNILFDWLFINSHFLNFEVEGGVHPELRLPLPLPCCVRYSAVVNELCKTTTTTITTTTTTTTTTTATTKQTKSC